jgi:hypothetical protein
MSDQSLPSLKEAAKSLLQISFHKMGYAVQRYDPEKHRPPGLAPLFEDPKEALCYQQGGKDAAFNCPVDRCVHAVGFRYGLDRWNPFVATLQEYECEGTDYDNSLLKQYYQAWTPSSASEAIAGFSNAPPCFEDLHPICLHVTPWRTHSPSEVAKSVQSWYEKDHKRISDTFTIESSGLKYFGPVSAEKGRLEFNRFAQAYNSIKEFGYDRHQGELPVQTLHRDGELLFLLRGNFHRTAAVAALGYVAIPATFASSHCIDVKDVDYWPQVRRGVWPRQAAIDYFNHLFDFDSTAWARERGLLSQ